MRTLIIGDLHINEQSIKEIEEIFEKDILPIEADRFIQLGDWFDHNTPTPAELKFSSELVLKLKKKYKEIIILSGTGEHDIKNNISVIEHLSSLGVKTIKGDYIESKILYGHFMVNESRFAFGTGKCGKKDLAQYDYVFLGHQHNPETILPNITHVGSIRYVTFNEVGDSKRIVLLENNTFAKFIELKSPIPMIDITDVTKLEQIYARTKVRVIFNSFDDYKKNASYVNKIGKKFFQFKIKMNFEESKKLEQSSIKLDEKKTNKSNIIQSYIDKIVDKDVKEILNKEFKK